MSTQNAVTEYFEAIRNKDTDRFVNAFAPDGVTHDPVGTPPHAGHEAIRAFFTGIAGAFETLNLVEEAIFLNGNSAAVKWNGAGVGKNGKHISFAGIDVLDCNDDGKIVLVRAFWDPAPVMSALQN
jgi:steroid delta-isomerase